MRKLALLVITIVLLLSACREKGDGDLPLPPANLFTNTANIAQGQRLFVRHCAECHGSLAEGRTRRAARLTPPAPDFHEQRYRKTLPGYLYRRIERGNRIEPFGSSGSVMPPWGAYLKAEQIWALVAFIRDRAGGAPLSP